jgi:hypothetical protein
MGPFKILTFIIATTLCAVFTFITLVAAAAIDEGTGGSVFITISLAKLFYIFRFPTHTLFWSFITDEGGSFLFFGGLYINSCFYGLIIERSIAYFKHRRLKTGK